MNSPFLKSVKLRQIGRPIMDCGHNETYRVISAYTKTDPTITVVRQPDLGEIELPKAKAKFRGYYNIARHYKFALHHTLVARGHEAVIIVEGEIGPTSPCLGEHTKTSVLDTVTAKVRRSLAAHGLHKHLRSPSPQFEKESYGGHAPALGRRGPDTFIYAYICTTIYQRVASVCAYGPLISSYYHNFKYRDESGPIEVMVDTPASDDIKDAISHFMFTRAKLRTKASLYKY
ncbi:Alpha-1,3-mannosyl-glycoprotein 2-beta-N-acetylglucosaminyltransferase [Eumeta japonica]|uniref:Alpha-1,3-mannosyl-glycoprotein 2-beta-N-acetylglucosaminyltransferase n=1 Tax=Eumeta variegata TaxID=151549 RepID=A0A4C1VEI3_EUMVA|nr:Alpha-1,3-mannosyl-glycoprotein 2-beta-N-acetylglucosaminyltransferase [Eumeta japonica]